MMLYNDEEVTIIKNGTVLTLVEYTHKFKTLPPDKRQFHVKTEDISSMEESEQIISKDDIDTAMASQIASILGWEWNYGEWQKDGVYQTEYFDPMNDEIQAQAVAKELNVDLTSVAKGQGHLTIAQAICFCICKKGIES